MSDDVLVIVIDDSPDIVNVDVIESESPDVFVTITDPAGPPGPPGPQGIPGLPGPTGEILSYLHTQVSPLIFWTINHNLGFKPLISIYDPGSVEVLAQIIHTSVNQTMVYFSTPTAGFARLI